MSASDSLNPIQFDNDARREMFNKAKSRPGTEVFYGSPKDRYVENPLGAHIPPPVREDFEDGSYVHHSQSGIPGYDRTAMVERPRRVEQVPLDRLESTQPYVSRTHVNNMLRRKGQAPPIDVTHHTGVDRYVVSEGNHRAMAAIKRGDTHIPALVTRITPWDRP